MVQQTPTRRSRDSRFWIEAGEAAELRTERQAADDALRWTNDEQFVVDRLIAGRVAKEIADRDQHFPLRAAEIHEGQRLTHLHVETRIERRRLLARGARGMRERMLTR